MKGGVGSVSGQGTKILYATQPKKKNQQIKKKELAWLGQSHLDNLPFTILGDIITGAVSHQIQVLKNNLYI